MKIKLLSLLLVATTSVYATNFVGDGFGQSHKEAKKESLADLSFSIKSEVKSTIQSHKDNKGANSVLKDLKVSSDLPIIGSEFTLSDFGNGYKALSTLDTSKAKPLYRDKLKSLKAEINTLATQVKSENKTAQYRTYMQLLSLLDNYDRYRSVAAVLGVEDISDAKISLSEVKLQIATLSESFSDLKQAIGAVTKGIKAKSIYVFPPKAENSNEITPFAKVVRSYLSQNVNSTKSVGDAKAFLRGEYLIDSKGMSLSISVINQAKEVLFSNVVRLEPSAYSSYSIKPKSIDFDKLLHEGYITKSKMKARLKTANGDEDLLFVAGDTVRLFAKLNNPGYFYLVGHVEQDGKKFSYIVDLSEVDGQTKFVQNVDVEDANKWMMLGEFEVEAPFGIESMQMIASSKKITKLPKHYYDEDSGYHVLGSDPRKVAVATRGLKKKMSKKAQVAEAVLMFTTMKK